MLSAAFLFVCALAVQERQVIGAEEDPSDPVENPAPPSDDPADMAPKPKPKQAAPRPSTRSLPNRPAAVAPPADARADEDAKRAIRGGACAGCVAGGLASGATAVLPLLTINQGGFNGCGAICSIVGVVGCGVCSSTGAVVGAGIGATAVGRDAFEISPWILSGVVIGVGSILLPLAAVVLGSSGFTPPGELQGPMILLWGALLLAAGPVSVASTFLTDLPTKEEE